MRLSDSMEDYLKAIYHLQYGSDERVRTVDIASELDVTSPTVTSMLDKLEERGLIDREKYHGVRLTDKGETVALEVIRHHRLLETFLTEHLDYNWSEVHEEADRLEHHISENFVDRIAAILNHPEIDPHGDPIPNVDLEAPVTGDATAVSECDEGDVVVVERVSDRDPEVLEYLADRGIEPGSKLTIVEVAPFGMITARSSESDDPVSLPERIARDVHVVRAAVA
ncbi:metal-dependent transcriptional regulator [Halorubrum sp. DTA98]|uniref:metal-dependent transcriptional regulator n=1 Tax=Halorubrum sp. DTA98 TaxID=3402163 RepID=UPI003AAB4B40